MNYFSSKMEQPFRYFTRHSNRSMNFLAHIYLSGNSDEISIGNFIGDYVKGRDYNHYPDLIRKGILLHRSIDDFTDHHPVVRRSKSFLYEKYRRYSGVIVDVFYDHFLTVEWDNFSQQPLLDYVSHFYKNLLVHRVFLPQAIKNFLPSCMVESWIETYGTLDGIKKVFRKMSRRTSLPKNSWQSVRELKRNYSAFREDFVEFFPLLINFVDEEHNINIEYPQAIHFKESG